jgi:hypothetical protein
MNNNMGVITWTVTHLAGQVYVLSTERERDSYKNNVQSAEDSS